MINKKFFVVMLALLLCINFASAFKQKIYDEETRKLVIENRKWYDPFGWVFEENLNEITLKTPTINKVGLGYQKVAEIEAKDISILQFLNAQNFKTYNVRDKMKPITRELDFKFLDYVIVQEDTFYCETIRTKNGTNLEECFKNGTVTKNKEIWRDINAYDLGTKTVTIGIFTTVKRGDKVDWVPTLYDVEVTEWAEWEASLNTNLTNWWTLNETSGNAKNYVGSIQGVPQGSITQNVQGVKSTAWDFAGTNGVANTTSNVDLVDTTSAWTLNLWINKSSNAGNIFYSEGNTAVANRYFFIGMRTNGTVEVEFIGASGTMYMLSNTSNLPNNTWIMVTVVRNSATSWELWINGTLADTDAVNPGDPSSTRTCWGALCRSTTAVYWDGGIDEIATWNRNLSDSEVILLYNEGNGCTYNFCENTGININITSPANNTFTSNNNITFTIDVLDYGNAIENVSLIFNGTYNETNISGFNDTTYTFNKILADNFYNWTVGVCNDGGFCLNKSRLLTIDATAPTFVTGTQADVITEVLVYNTTISINATDPNLDDCFYYTTDNGTNTTTTCNTPFSVPWYSGGNKTIYYYANDSAGNLNTTNISFFINYVAVGIVYTSPAIEGTNTTIILNLTANNIDTFTGSLTWNGTSNSSTNSSNSTFGTLTNYFIVPTVTSNQNVTFNYTYTLNGVNYTTANRFQIVAVLPALNVSTSCSDKALRFWVQNEANLTNVTADIYYNLQYGDTFNNTYKRTYGTLTNVSDFYICINATVRQNYTLGYGELQYINEDYIDRRYYLFTNLTLTNTTVAQHYLRVLPTADQTSFLITFEDNNLNAYTEKYSAMWRWYPDLDQYQIVEMGKTDSDGQTVAHVRTEDVDYRTALYEQNGTLIAFDDPRRFVCTTSPCSLTIRPNEAELDQTSFFDVVVSLDYNETTKVFTLTYNDPNQDTTGMSLLVERLSGTNTLTLCNSTSSGFSGVISCNASAYTGTFKATAYRYASPGVPIAQKIVSTANTVFKSGFGLFISSLIWLAVALTGLTGNPIVIIVASIIGLVPALILGTINATIFTGLAVLGAIILHFIRRALG